jgi:hypothetical protein
MADVVRGALCLDEYQRRSAIINLRANLAGVTVRRSRLQSDKISHIDMGDDRIDTVISHIMNPYPVSIFRMTTSIW